MTVDAPLAWFASFMLFVFGCFILTNTVEARLSDKMQKVVIATVLLCCLPLIIRCFLTALEIIK